MVPDNKPRHQEWNHREQCVAEEPADADGDRGLGAALTSDDLIPRFRDGRNLVYVTHERNPCRSAGRRKLKPRLARCWYVRDYQQFCDPDTLQIAGTQDLDY